jgi:hypothetical protein
MMAASGIALRLGCFGGSYVQKMLQDSDDMSRQQTALAVNCRLL